MDYINRWLGSELLMFCILPWGYAAAVALLLILMFSKKRSRQILLWVLLPQWAVVVLLLLTLQYTQLLSQTGTVWMLMLLLPILSWAACCPRCCWEPGCASRGPHGCCAILCSLGCCAR